MKCDESSATGESDILKKTAADEVYRAMRSAQSEAIKQKSTWQVSLREQNGVVQWAVHQAQAGTFIPDAVSANDSLWQNLEQNIQIDKEQNDQGFGTGWSNSPTTQVTRFLELPMEARAAKSISNEVARLYANKVVVNAAPFRLILSDAFINDGQIVKYIAGVLRLCLLVRLLTLICSQPPHSSFVRHIYQDVRRGESQESQSRPRSPADAYESRHLRAIPLER